MFSGVALADPGTETVSVHTHKASEHAPIGVMGDHTHDKGEWMVSYRYMRMHMDGTRDGTNNLAPEDVATSVPNRFFGNPSQPPTLRVVPTRMSMDMHMLGVMYAPTDRITLMAMTQYVTKDMDHITFAGGMGTNRLGQFTTRTDGIGDTTIGALVRLVHSDRHKLHFNAALSLPTGSIDESGQVLAPNGATPTVRLPYAMQLGSGTFDLKPGLTYQGRQEDLSWGAQANATLRLDENSEGYKLGDKLTVSAWGAYDWTPGLSSSLRISATSLGQIGGNDSQIVAPVQTADPNNYGGENIAIGLGANFKFSSGPAKGHRLALEANVPVYRELNGPQLETDWTLTAGWQKSF